VDGAGQAGRGEHRDQTDDHDHPADDQSERRQAEPGHRYDGPAVAEHPRRADDAPGQQRGQRPQSDRCRGESQISAVRDARHHRPAQPLPAQSGQLLAPGRALHRGRQRERPDRQHETDQRDRE